MLTQECLYLSKQEAGLKGFGEGSSTPECNEPDEVLKHHPPVNGGVYDQGESSSAPDFNIYILLCHSSTPSKCPSTSAQNLHVFLLEGIVGQCGTEAVGPVPLRLLPVTVKRESSTVRGTVARTAWQSLAHSTMSSRPWEGRERHSVP